MQQRRIECVFFTHQNATIESSFHSNSASPKTFVLRGNRILLVVEAIRAKLCFINRITSQHKPCMLKNPAIAFAGFFEQYSIGKLLVKFKSAAICLNAAVARDNQSKPKRRKVLPKACFQWYWLPKLDFKFETVQLNFIYLGENVTYFWSPNRSRPYSGCELGIGTPQNSMFMNIHQERAVNPKTRKVAHSKCNRQTIWAAVAL